MNHLPVFLLLAVCAGAAAAEPVSLRSLLAAMGDPERLTRLPDPAYTLRLFSSYDRASTAPGKPEWFANGDATQFLRIETRAGRTEHVMLDAEGPGALVRTWFTIANSDGSGILRVYLDRADVPAIEGKVIELVGGSALCPPPLSASVSLATGLLQRGHNLYLPIPYARHCLVTYESAKVVEKREALYYNLETRTYPAGTAVETFTAEGLKAAGEAVAAANRALLGQGPEPALASQPLAGTIAPGGTLVRTLEGPGAIHRLSLSLGSAPGFDQALRSTVIELAFDGERTVWAPVGEFFGTGYHRSAFATRYASCDANGVLTSRWVMPFAKTCTVTLRNLGSAPVTVADGAIATAPYPWDDTAMHFGASWHQMGRHPVGRKVDANYATLGGRGVLVGTAVTVFNTVDSWWGEGDEKIYVDGETFPSFFGTGSEDYYGYAWCNGNRFEHPFLCQPEGTGAVRQGLAVNARYRLLDAIPFATSLRFDMEIHHHSNNALINYAPAAFWYMRPGGTAALGDGRLAPGSEQIQTMAGEPIARRRGDVMARMVPFAGGRLEGEALDGTAPSGAMTFPRGWGERWSGGEAICWSGGKDGDSARLVFPSSVAGPGETLLYLSCRPDHGRFRIAINGKTLVEEVDTFAELNGVLRLDINRGVELREGENLIEVTLLGRNPRAKGANFCLDYLECHVQRR